MILLFFFLCVVFSLFCCWCLMWCFFCCIAFVARSKLLLGARYDERDRATIICSSRESINHTLAVLGSGGSLAEEELTSCIFPYKYGLLSGRRTRSRRESSVKHNQLTSVNIGVCVEACKSCSTKCTSGPRSASPAQVGWGGNLWAG